MKTFEAFAIDRVLPLDDRDYIKAVRLLIQQARRRIWICQFHVNMYPLEDLGKTVQNLIKELANATERYIDVRILLERGKGNRSIYLRNQQSQMFISHLGIPNRFFHGDKSSLHAKYLIIDKNISIVGSQNFSYGALCTHRESSVAVFSNDMNIRLSQHFEFMWKRSEEALAGLPGNKGDNLSREG